MQEEGEEDYPEGVVVPLRVRLVDEVDFVEVGDLVGQVIDLHLGREQGHHQAAAEACDERKLVEETQLLRRQQDRYAFVMLYLVVCKLSVSAGESEEKICSKEPGRDLTPDTFTLNSI